MDLEMKDIYHQNLEIAIILFISEHKNISIYEAMNIYYKSKLASLIESETCGIENMSPQYLALDIIENERELFTEL